MGKRAIRGSIWVIGGFGLTQVLRLVSIIVLSRLLDPGAFGLMAVVQVVVMGVAMFSDAGLRGSIIYDRRGDEPTFLNTAFTLQSIRGVGVALIIVLLSVPAAHFYDKPPLVYLLPAIALTAAFEGLMSTAVHSLARQVTPAPWVVLQAVARATSLVVMVSLAWVWPSVWVLAIGAILTSLVQMLGSHRLIRGYRNRFHLDVEIARSMLKYGRWIFLSSALTFLLGQGDRLILAKLLDKDALGIYSQAFLLVNAVIEGMNAIASSVLQPLYAQFAREHSHQVRRKTLKVRGALLAASLPVLWGMALFGPEIVGLIFDDRWQEAGWMMQVLAVGAVGVLVSTTAERVFTATGDSFSHMILKTVASVLFVAGMVVGGLSGHGLLGLLVGISVARLLAYIPLAILLRRKGVWLPELDALAFGVSLAVIGGGLMSRTWGL